jgi:N-acetylmuramoyl-L-alanine amidase
VLASSHRLTVFCVGLAFSTEAFAGDLAKAKAASRADQAYAEARQAYGSLKNDERRRKFRDQWTLVIEKFERVAEKHPRSPRAAEALYGAAGLYAELSRVSLARRDLRAAIDGYRRLCERYPRASLADDAHMALGRIYLDRQGDAPLAQAEFRAAAACKGDQLAKARAALSTVGPAVEVASAAGKASAVGVVAQRKGSSETASANARTQVRRKADRDGKGPPDAASAVPAPREEDKGASEAPPATREPGFSPQQVAAIRSVTGTEVPLSLQAGLKVKRVIIDAGHGGHDTGAIGPTGVREKDVALAIAKKLESTLEARGVDALLTRDADAFVALEDRARFANLHRGDLFVSIHCNAHKSPKLRGIETYTLNVTSDRYAIKLAARENAASERTLSDLQFILADLAAKSNTGDSQRLARATQGSLIAAHGAGANRPRDLGIKQALFYVLLGAKMPAILVETGFITHPEDEQRLRDAEYQATLAGALADGIGRFVSEREQLAHALTE